MFILSGVLCLKRGRAAFTSLRCLLLSRFPQAVSSPCPIDPIALTTACCPSAPESSIAGGDLSPCQAGLQGLCGCPSFAPAPGAGGEPGKEALGCGSVEANLKASAATTVLSPSVLQERQSQKGPESPQALSEVSPAGEGSGCWACEAGGGASEESVLLPLQVPPPGGSHSPEQRSFRERQKYFEVELKQQPAEKPPKRVSLVGEEDLKKMKEEEGEGWGGGV